MSIRILAVQFNHDGSSSQLSALNLRKNYEEIISLPEWLLEHGNSPQNSPAAYAINEVRERDLSIQVQLERLDPAIKSVELRAVYPESPQFPWWLPYYMVSPQQLWGANPTFRSYYDYYLYQLYIIQYSQWLSAVSGESNVLGEVIPTRISFAGAKKTGMVNVPLRNVRLTSRGVNVHTVLWQWQYRLRPDQPWIDVQQTQHKIYTTLDVPTLPWVQQPFLDSNLALPWADVLEFSCQWASENYTPITVASSITRAIFKLGDYLIEYGCPIGAREMYTNTPLNFFDCSAFIDLLKGGVGNGRYVNCTDCACIVTTFANILGTDLWQARMGEYIPSFNTNLINAIGTHLWDTPCSLDLGFTYHEVAWTGACDSFDSVYDACLEVDTDPFNLYLLPLPLLPKNMLFGLPFTGGYRTLMAAPDSQYICNPRPEERRRRALL